MHRLRTFFASPDPRLALANLVAFIVVGNQPFYPFYVWYVAGTFVPQAFLTWLSFPFFAAVPAVARRAPGVGRAWLLATAIGNTALSAWALGSAAGAEVFYLPSLVVAWTTARPGERAGPLAGTAAATAASSGLVHLLQPLAALTAAQAHALLVMHAVSAACLCAVLALQAWRIARGGPAVSRSGA